MSLSEKMQVVTKNGVLIDSGPLGVKRLHGGVYIDGKCEGLTHLEDGYFIPSTPRMANLAAFEEDLERFLEKHFTPAGQREALNNFFEQAVLTGQSSNEETAQIAQGFGITLGSKNN